MSIKGVLKKKFKIKNPITSIKKKKQKIKCISESLADSYVKFDPDNIKNKQLKKDKLKKKITSNEFKLSSNDHENIIDKSLSIETTNQKKCKTSNNDECEGELPKQKKVTFATDVKSEKDDQKCTAGKMIPISLNKRKKKNYLRKLKAMKNKQKKGKKCEENAVALSTPRQERAIEYLMQWKNNRSNWKFKKIYQLWLIKNTYNSSRVSIHYNLLTFIII